jgi:hypothetical protein
MSPRLDKSRLVLGCDIQVRKMEDAHANGPKRDEAGFRVAGVCRNVKRRERNGKHGSEFIFYCEDHELEMSEVKVRAVCRCVEKGSCVVLYRIGQVCTVHLGRGECQFPGTWKKI